MGYGVQMLFHGIGYMKSPPLLAAG